MEGITTLKGGGSNGGGSKGGSSNGGSSGEREMVNREEDSSRGRNVTVPGRTGWTPPPMIVSQPPLNIKSQSALLSRT